MTVVDHTTAVGRVVSAIIAQPQKSLGRYVFATNEEKYTLGKLFALWAEAAGVKDYKYIQVTDESYESLHGKLGTELGLMFKLWEKYPWSSEGVLLPKDLGVTGLKSLEQYLGENKWSAYL